MRILRLALVGHGIGASLTPAMLVREAAELGLACEHRLVDLLGDPTPLGAVLDRLDAEGSSACNVTHPHKQEVLGHLDRVDPGAAAVGAVNLVRFGGRPRRAGPAGARGRTGSNTDVTGFAAALRDGLPPGAALGRVVQLGAGGAGSATAHALLGAGTGELVVVDPDAGRAAALVERAARAHPGRSLRHVRTAGEAAEALAVADGVVNASPVGMAIHPGSPVDVTAVARGAWVADAVYRPLLTPLLRAARARGHVVLDGGRMAVGQAVDTLRLVTGLEPDAARVRAHFLELVAAEAGPQG